MFRKNPVTPIILEHLHKQKPRYPWFRTIILLSAFFFIAPLVHKFSCADGSLIIPMVLIGLLLYWIIQLNTLTLAQKVTVYDWQLDAPSELLGSISPSQVLWGKLWAVMRYQFHLYLIFSFGLLGMALTEAGFISRFVFGANNWGILCSPIELIRYFYPFTRTDSVNVAHLPHPIILLIVFFLIVSLSLSSAAVFTAIGLARREKPKKLTFILICSILIGWLSVHQLRNFLPSLGVETPYYRCWETGDCADMRRDRFILRVIESSEVTIVSFVDGGTLANMQLLGTYHYSGNYSSNELSWQPNMTRHILAMGLSAFLQCVFAIFLLRRNIQQSTKKKNEVF